MEDILSNARQPEVRLFSLFKCLDATKFELLSVVTLKATTDPKFWAKPLPKNAKSLLPVVPEKRLCLSSFLFLQTSHCPRSYEFDLT